VGAGVDEDQWGEVGGSGYHERSEAMKKLTAVSATAIGVACMGAAPAMANHGRGGPTRQRVVRCTVPLLT
jgi:hypothetical protein